MSKDTESLGVRQLGDEVRNLGRKVADLTRQVETLDQDRTIVEENQRAIRSLEEAVRLLREHMDTAIRELKLEIKVQGARVEDTVSDHVGTLVENIEKKKVVVIKESFMERAKKLLRR